MKQDKTTPIPSIPVNDESKINYYVDGGDYQRNNDPSEVYVRKEIDGEQFDICNMGCNDEPGDTYENALKIKTALANTYGKGLNPESCLPMFNALSAILDGINTKNKDLNIGSIKVICETILQNAKTIKP